MTSIRFGEDGTPNASFVDLVSDEDETWDDWDNFSKPKQSPTGLFKSPAVTGSAEPDPASSTTGSEPSGDLESLPHANGSNPISLGGNATTNSASGRLSPLASPLQNESNDADDSEDGILSSAIPPSPMEHQNASDTSSALPSGVREVLDKWYARKGCQKPPPCAVRKSASKTAHTTFTGGPVTYVHTSGEVLAVELYALPEFLDSDHDKTHVLVAVGETQGPFIISYKDTKTDGELCRNMRYLIWEGVDSQDKDGWEEHPSVSKIPKPRPEVIKPRSEAIITRPDASRPRSHGTNTSSTLPATIRSLLDDWYAREGRQKPPPCATVESNRGTLHCDYKGRPATYIHKSGEILAVEMFTLAEFIYTRATHKYAVIARGATLGPFIIGYYCSKGDGNGSHVVQYRIWEGIHSQDPNGWEENVSVEKRRTITKVGNTKEVDVGERESSGDSNGQVFGATSKTSSRISSSPIAQEIAEARPQNDHNILQLPTSSPIPAKIRKAINEWCLFQGSGHPLPFVTKTKDHNFTSSCSGRPAYFKHDNGTLLDVSTYPLGSQRPQDYGSNIIVANGPGSGPFLILVSNTGEGIGRSGCVYYYTWIGLNGDVDGFADTFTIAKYFGKLPKTKDGGNLGARKPSHKRVSDIAAPAPSPPKRHRLSTSADRSLKDSPNLDEHVRNNAVLLFFSTSSKTPRVRLLATCDSVQELFAQALAGDLFDESKRGPKILFILLAGQQIACKVVRDDVDDFESLITAIKGLNCWSIAGDTIEGSCTVEVRAVS
jgi:hypothetical protein